MKDLVGWVYYDGDEYYDFQYSTVMERRMMERGVVPVWRENRVPVYGEGEPTSSERSA